MIEECVTSQARLVERHLTSGDVILGKGEVESVRRINWGYDHLREQ